MHNLGERYTEYAQQFLFSSLVIDPNRKYIIEKKNFFPGPRRKKKKCWCRFKPYGVLS